MNQYVPTGPVPSGLPAQAPQSDQPPFSSTWLQVLADEGGVGIRLPLVAVALEVVMSAVAVAAAYAPVLSQARAITWCLPVVICTESVNVPEEVFCFFARFPSTYKAQPVIGFGPTAVALIVIGEELPIAFSATVKEAGAALAVVPAGMVTAADELPEMPAVLMAMAVIWCCPTVTGMHCAMVACELACCHTVAESTAICHCLMGKAELAVAEICTGDAACSGCMLTDTLEGVVAEEEDGKLLPAEPQPNATPNTLSNNQVAIVRKGPS